MAKAISTPGQGKYSSAVQAMKELPGEEVDLLFLDIQMPELNENEALLQQIPANFQNDETIVKIKELTDKQKKTGY